MAATVQHLKALGEEMGLSGSDLKEFVQGQQDREREERQKQREYETCPRIGSTES